MLPMPPRQILKEEDEDKLEQEAETERRQTFAGAIAPFPSFVH